MMRYFTLLLLLIPCFALAQGVFKQVPDGFRFRMLNSEQSWPAVVPGTVHTDLMNNGLIDHPFADENESTMQWISDSTWVYYTILRPGINIRKQSRTELVFEGLDTYAEIYLDGDLVLKADNMFREWVVNADKYLHKDSCILEIIFKPAYKTGLPLVGSITLPADNDKGEIKTSVYTRKAPYHYGWDWGPRFLTCGIWKAVYMRAWSDYRICDVYLRQDKIKGNKAEITAEVTIESLFPSKGLLVITSPEANIRFTKTVFIDKGVKTYSFPLVVSNPKLWWTHDLGEPYIYHFTTTLTGIDTVFTNIGLRTVELEQKADSSGTSFRFLLNGTPIFAKGSNLIPPDVFLPGKETAKYRELLEFAVESEMNMIRVWGGGVYPDDEFFEICDSKGILVWQDFMFACSLYPWDTTFLKNVENEATYQVKRLRNHPCIALWCGNNEVDEAWKNWGYQKKYQYSETDTVLIWRGYQSLFEKLLPSVVQKNTRGMSYIPSSPKYGWGNKISYTSGDSHFWGVWWGKMPFTAYREYTGRFVSEYGFQSLPMSTGWYPYLKSSGFRLDSPGLLMHQKSPEGFNRMTERINEKFIGPTDTEIFAYLSQVVQLDALTAAITAHRLSSPRCMGTLFWQLNDCWPAVSWSVIDYNGNKKVGAWRLRELFSPIAFFADTNMTIMLVSDIKGDSIVKASCHIITWNGDTLASHENMQTIKGLGNIPFFTFSATEKKWLSEAENYLLVCHQGTKKIFHFSKRQSLPEENLEIVTIQTAEGIWETTVRAISLTEGLLISADIPGTWNKNYVDLSPGDKIKLEFRASNSGSKPEFRIFTRNRYMTRH